MSSPLSQREPTAQDVALYMLRTMGPMSFVKLQCGMYLISMAYYRDQGRPIFKESFIALRWGPCVRSVTRDWHRRAVLKLRREPRRHRALRLRVRRWATQEAARKDANKRLGKINMPGGWSERDAIAQRRGLSAAFNRSSP